MRRCGRWDGGDASVSSWSTRGELRSSMEMEGGGAEFVRWWVGGAVAAVAAVAEEEDASSSRDVDCISPRSRCEMRSNANYI